MSEAKCSITEAKCLQMSHSKYAFQRNATTLFEYVFSNLLVVSHSAGMHNIGISVAGISK